MKRLVKPKISKARSGLIAVSKFFGLLFAWAKEKIRAWRSETLRDAKGEKHGGESKLMGFASSLQRWSPRLFLMASLSLHALI